jgi:predicted acetyltransferase
MELQIIKASIEDYPLIQNMARFYVYDMSLHCGHLAGWGLPQDGLYECFDLKSYFTDLDKYSLLIKVKNEVAGFAMINKTGSTKDIDWNMAEFFILAKF